jgi:hypothetical protein
MLDDVPPEGGLGRKPEGGRILLVLAGLMVGCGGDTSAPKQPLAFSHRVHAGQNAIGCTSCHVYAERSTIAGVPSLARCMGCHKFVATEDTRVKTLARANEEGKPLEWVRINRVPDHVYFTHARHIGAGVRCQECHGAIEGMDVVKPVSTFSMGFCVDCHRRRGAPRECITCHK